ncbi:MAG: ATP-binding protein [Bdellovibrionaceae bacterium]|nr:ATP-binding protein [Pseudobdellovibrionaceae bacterium]MDW8189399.1 ATP-binding protein [Pseudobdellovibrionaceae bacterium]
MKYVWLIPSIIYALLIILAGAIYLIEGYLVQIRTLQILYFIGALGLIGQSIIIFWEQRKKIVTRSIQVLDLILISSAMFLVTSGQSLLFFLVLVYVFYTGLTGSHRWLDLVTGYFIFVNVISQYLMFDQMTLPDILMQLIFAMSLLVVNFMSRSVAASFSEEQQKNAFLQKLNQAIFANVPYGFLVTNPDDGTLVHYNPYLRDLFLKVRPQTNPFEVTSLFEIFPELKTLDTSDRMGLDLIHKVADGFVFLRAKLVKLLGITPHSNLYIIEDRTEIERLEMSRRQSEKLAAIGTLAAGIAHEIRNPLAGISGALQLLEPNIVTDESKRLVKIVFREIDRLNGLITEFLDFARPEPPPPTSLVNLKTILTDCFLVVVNDPRFPFLKDLKPFQFEEDFFILGYSDKLKQMFVNIMVNAAESMIQSPEKKLQVTLKKQDNLVKVVIEDTGEGMDSETVQKIFEPFFTTKDKGTGLGMAIVLKIVQNHRGYIFVESQKGKGTRIEIHFPTAVT